MPTIFFMIGVAGSGKSTFVKDNANSDDIILSTDNYLEEYARLNDLTYNESFEMKFKDADRSMKADLQFALQHKKNIIWDQTNVTKNARATKLSRIPKDYKKIAVFLNTPRDTIISENQKRIEKGRSLPSGVLDNMLNSLQPPSKDEGFDDIIVIERHS